LPSGKQQTPEKPSALGIRFRNTQQPEINHGTLLAKCHQEVSELIETLKTVEKLVRRYLK
jgi:hypothetical protein